MRMEEHCHGIPRSCPRKGQYQGELAEVIVGTRVDAKPLQKLEDTVESLLDRIEERCDISVNCGATGVCLLEIVLEYEKTLHES